MDFETAIRELDRIPGRLDATLTRAMKDIAPTIRSEAKKNAPKSPTQQELDDDRLKKYAAKYSKKYGEKIGTKMAKARLARVRKRRKVDDKGQSASRKPTASSRPAPGGLEKSIASEVIKEGQNIDGSIFVSDNSEAKEYAAIIHDRKGSVWFERGIATEKKGARADEKFIERAVNASDASIARILEAEINRALESIP